MPTELKKSYARHMRKKPTPSEKKLWGALRRSQLGVKIAHQKIIRGYIADFYCPAAKLLIEVDGATHNTDAAKTYDKQRDENLRTCGYQTLRVTASQVMADLPSTVQYIKEAIDAKVSTDHLSIRLHRESWVLAGIALAVRFIASRDSSLAANLRMQGHNLASESIDPALKRVQLEMWERLYPHVHLP
jgi:very-short-patch-repair endonuclease